MRQIGGIEFALDPAAMTKQAALGDAVPFRDQVRGHENGFAARGLGLEHFLEAMTPAGIEAQARFIEEQDGRIRQKEERDPEPLPHPAGKRAGALMCRAR